MRTTIGNVTRFIFPADEKFYDEFPSKEILDWMDTEIKKSAFISIELLEMRKNDAGEYLMSYIVNQRLKINPEYAAKHLAMRDFVKS